MKKSLFTVVFLALAAVFAGTVLAGCDTYGYTGIEVDEVEASWVKGTWTGTCTVTPITNGSYGESSSQKVTLVFETDDEVAWGVLMFKSWANEGTLYQKDGSNYGAIEYSKVNKDKETKNGYRLLYRFTHSSSTSDSSSDANNNGDTSGLDSTDGE